MLLAGTDWRSSPEMMAEAMLPPPRKARVLVWRVGILIIFFLLLPLGNEVKVYVEGWFVWWMGQLGGDGDCNGDGRGSSVGEGHVMMVAPLAS